MLVKDSGQLAAPFLSPVLMLTSSFGIMISQPSKSLKLPQRQGFLSQVEGSPMLERCIAVIETKRLQWFLTVPIDQHFSTSPSLTMRTDTNSKAKEKPQNVVIAMPNLTQPIGCCAINRTAPDF